MKSYADTLLNFYIAILILMVIGTIIGIFSIKNSIGHEKICHDNGGNYIRDYGISHSNHYGDSSLYVCAKLEIIKEMK